MKNENRYQLLIWAIVVLAVMNISTIVTLVYHKYQSGQENPVTNDPKLAELNADRFSGRYFRDELKLDNLQMEKFKVINPAFRPKAKWITLELAEKRKEMLREMVATPSDTIRLNNLSDSIGLLHSRLKKITFQYYLELKGICTKEQQIRLEKIFGEMFTNDVPLGSSGKGGPTGWQGGRR